MGRPCAAFSRPSKKENPLFQNKHLTKTNLKMKKILTLCMATLMMAVLFGSCSSDDGFDYIAESSGIMTRGVSDDDMVKMRLEVRYDSAVTRNKRFVKFFYIKLRDPNTNDSCIAYASLDDHTHNFWDHHTPFDRGVLIPKRWQNLKEGEYWEIEANVEVFPYYDGDLKISLYNLGVETTWQIDNTWIDTGTDAGTGHTFKGRLYTDLDYPDFHLMIKVEKRFK